MEYLSLVPATALGYLTFRATTHPNSRIWKRIPHFKAKRVQVFPSLRIKIAGRTIHLHHWINCSILLVLSGVEPTGILTNTLARGLLLGGVIQGLTLPREHRRFIYKEPHPSLKYPNL